MSVLLTFALTNVQAANDGMTRWPAYKEYSFTFDPMNGLEIQIYTPPPVTVTARYCSADPECSATYNCLKAQGDAGIANWLQSLNNLGDDVQLTAKSPFDKPDDVRTNCFIPGRQGLAHTVSTDDEAARRDAVSSIVGAGAVFWSQQMVRARFLGKTTAIGDTKYFKANFTYADGGSEDRYVNAMSMDNNIPAGNYKPGDGIEKDVPC